MDFTQKHRSQIAHLQLNEVLCKWLHSYQIGCHNHCRGIVRAIVVGWSVLSCRWREGLHYQFSEINVWWYKTIEVKQQYSPIDTRGCVQLQQHSMLLIYSEDVVYTSTGFEPTPVEPPRVVCSFPNVASFSDIIYYLYTQTCTPCTCFQTWKQHHTTANKKTHVRHTLHQYRAVGLLRLGPVTQYEVN